MSGKGGMMTTVLRPVTASTIGKTHLQNQRFSERCCWTLEYSGMLRRVGRWMVSDVSKDRSAYIFRMKQSKNSGKGTFVPPITEWLMWNTRATQWEECCCTDGGQPPLLSYASPPILGNTLPEDVHLTGRQKEEGAVSDLFQANNYYVCSNLKTDSYLTNNWRYVSTRVLRKLWKGNIFFVLNLTFLYIYWLLNMVKYSFTMFFTRHVTCQQILLDQITASQLS